MKFLLSTLAIVICSGFALFADSLTIVGVTNPDVGVYWAMVPPADPGNPSALDIGIYTDGYPRGVGYAPDKTVYIVGNLQDSDDNSVAVYWTVSPEGVASNYFSLCPSSNIFQVTANAVAFNADGIAYIVGTDNTAQASCWIVTADGVVDSQILLPLGHFATGIGFTSTGKGYISGSDQENNLCYWTIDVGNVISGPFYLVGGEQGGAAYSNGVGITRSDTIYILGSNQGGYASYWTISPLDVASADFVLDGGFNSQAYDAAFLATGEGVIVGQGSNNTSCYWSVEADGTTGLLTALPNGSGSGSAARGVAYDSLGTAYIIGLDNSNNAVFWTLPLNSLIATYHLLAEGTVGIAYGIDSYLMPNPPTDLSGTFVQNSFGWIYEYCVVLKWSASDSENVVGYNIYKNGVKIGSVGSTILEYHNHNQNKRQKAVYAVTTVDESGYESVPITIIVN